ncbi:MAG: hypothetical protein F4Y45_18200 [Acidobacteria bacterium]|nr:hypothetical protein [Acidobacteriota bacterium]MYJ05284.1 hypothetical protein [Acidobacteriota bacterium]
MTMRFSWHGPIVCAALLLALAPAALAQSGNGGETPRTPDGHPDISGVWDFRTVTPLERPEQFADKEFLTEEEAAAYEQERVLANNADLNREDTTTDRAVVNGTRESADLRLAYNDFWWDRGTTAVETRRTSLVVDPPNGRIPSLTEAAQARRDERVRISQRPSEGPEDRSLAERCITGFNSGPPMLPAAYNMNVQIFQTKDHVVLLNEMVHNARIIPLDGSTHDVPLWTGMSTGRWEGDTLVVETKNFLRETSFRDSSQNLMLTERFRRLDDDTLVYGFTVEDPTTWTAPWTVELPMRRSDLPIFEYACHEGNYGMEGTLSGARHVESR